MFVCKQEDDFVFEQPRWIAHLSNGEKIIQDDGRPETEPPQAWLRLKDYCRQEGVDVVNLTLQFRSNHQSPLPANASGYYFVNKIVKIQGMDCLQFCLIGYIKDDKVRVQHWKMPELLLLGEEEREIKESDPCLIRNIND